MRIMTVAAATIGLLASLSAAHAGDQDFDLVNHTGYDIDKVFVSAVNQKSWGKDIMGRDSLEDGQTVHITFNGGTEACRHDLKVVYSDGDTSEWGGLNLCKINTVTLYWDRKAGTTRATVD